ADARSVALDYPSVLVSAGNNDLYSYDASNFYAPVLKHALLNSKGVAQDALCLANGLFVAKGADGVHWGSAAGADFTTLSGTADVIDVACDERSVYLLRAATLETRGLQAPTSVLSTQAHGVIGARFLRSAAQRLVVVGSSSLAGFTTGRIQAGALESLGVFNQPGLVDAAFGGELLAVAPNTSEIRLYDVAPSSGSMSTREIAKVVAGVSGKLSFDGEMLEWSSAGYKNAKVPLAHAMAIEPARSIAAADQHLALGVTGSADAWTSARLDVTDELGEPIAGTSVAIGQRLEFAPAGALFTQGGLRYRVDFAVDATEVIRGGHVDDDLGFWLDSVPLFGAAPISLSSVRPEFVRRGVTTLLTLSGSALDQVDSLAFNGVPALPGSWQVGPGGTTLTLSTSFASAGLYGVTIGAGSSSFGLPTAFVVSDPLSVTSALAASGVGAAKIGDSGDVLNVVGTGLDASVTAHFLRDDVGFTADASNRISAITYTGAGLSFATPACVIGLDYAAVFLKPLTGESVRVGGLRCTDNTAPRLLSTVSPSYFTPFKGSYSEPMLATGFSVVSTPLDYSNDPASDISSWFTLTSSDNDLILSLNAGHQLTYNHSYAFSINGVTDAAGHTAVGPGAGPNLTSTFRAADTLEPRNIAVSLPGGVLLSDASVLTRGRTYHLTASADENYPLSVEYSFRVSRDGGQTYAAPVTASQYDLSVGLGDDRLGVQVSVKDGNGNVAKATSVFGTSEPEILLAGVFTDPDPVEEQTRGDVYFHVSGLDAALVGSADIEILGQTFSNLSLINLVGGVREVRLKSYLQPRLVDLDGGVVPVRLTAHYGAGAKSLVSSYQVRADATPPTISIVSPKDGSSVPTGEATLVTIRSFDQYGVKEVRVAVNDVFQAQPLADPTRYSFTPSGTTPIKITARATDPSGNQAESSVTLYPFKPDARNPSVAIVSPVNGSTLRERENVTFDVALSNATDADLFLDVSGDSANPQNPPSVPVHRESDGPERLQVLARMPALDADKLVVARFRERVGGRTARIVLNVLNDDTVQGSAQLDLTPSGAVLGGTPLWVKATPPAGMTDFSTASSLAVEQPAGSALLTAPLDGTRRSVVLSSAAGGARVASQLLDRSGNVSAATRDVPVLPYLSTSAVLAAPAQAS
ncbi:MAG TPA: Ig-like domain-containing protein, partial [Polyangiaceae bacterium]|nr:Ig-like domain-containing protein [Polyangiaceae bacterium]